MADSDEGVLGEDFYDFYYEIERIVVGGPPKPVSTVIVDGYIVVPSPKISRIVYTMSATEETQLSRGLIVKLVLLGMERTVILGRRCVGLKRILLKTVRMIMSYLWTTWLEKMKKLRWKRDNKKKVFLLQVVGPISGFGKTS
jgi:hypothetical protein